MTRTIKETDFFTIAIVGGGFSGTMVAVHLLRCLSATDRTRIILIEREEATGLGAAYSTTEPRHLLNVRACNMSAMPDEPDSFVHWLQNNSPFQEWVLPAENLSDAYAPRLLYGRYVQGLLRAAIAQAPGGVTLDVRQDEAVSIQLDHTGGIVQFENGERLAADRIVLALGNLPPRDPSGVDPVIVESALYMRDPWSARSLDDLDPDDSVLLIGTGLTMVDIAISLHRRGHRGKIHAVSRRGLLPQPHRPVEPIESILGEDSLPRTVRELLRMICEKISDPTNHGWRSVMNSLRAVTPKLWRTLPLDEKRRFLRHVQAYWETHRHRMAPDVAATISRMQADGMLVVRAGRILGASETPDGLDVTIRDRRAGGDVKFKAARVINCTGPSLSPEHLRHALLKQLLADGLVRPDPLGLGLDVSTGWRCIDSTGNPSPALYLLGTLCKGTLWETSAVPELREQAAEVAHQLLNGVRQIRLPESLSANS